MNCNNISAIIFLILFGAVGSARCDTTVVIEIYFVESVGDSKRDSMLKFRVEYAAESEISGISTFGPNGGIKLEGRRGNSLGEISLDNSRFPNSRLILDSVSPNVVLRILDSRIGIILRDDDENVVPPTKKIVYFDANLSAR